MSSVFLLPSGGDAVTALGSTYHVKTDGAHVAAAYSLLEEEFWGATTPLHAHPDAEESRACGSRSWLDFEWTRTGLADPQLDFGGACVRTRSE